MVKVVIEGKGTTLLGILDDLRVTIEDLANDKGQLVPEDPLSAVVSYVAAVRRQSGGQYVSGSNHPNPELAFSQAVQQAGFQVYDPAKHRIKITAAVELQPAAGRPSSADGYRPKDQDLTGKMF